MSETSKYRELTQQYCYRGDGKPGLVLDVASQGDPVVPWAWSLDLPPEKFNWYSHGTPAAGPIQLRGDGAHLPVDSCSLDCLYCLAPGTLIETNRGMIPVEAVLQGDTIVSHAGERRLVAAVAVNQRTEDIVSLKVERLPWELKLTANHRVLVWQDGKEVFVEAGCLTVGDRIISPYSKVCRDVAFLATRQLLPENNPKYQRVLSLKAAGLNMDQIAESTGVPRSTVWQYTTSRRTPSDCFVEWEGWVTSSIKTVSVKAKVPVDGGLMRLIGYYVSDGCASNAKPYSVAFYFGKTECEYRDNAIALIKRLFGVDPVRQAFGERKSIYHVRYCSKLLWHIFRALGGAPGAKRIPQWIMHLPPEKQIHLLGGLFSGDGTVSKTEASYCSANPGLAMQVRELLLRQGMPVSLHRVEQDSNLQGRSVKSVRYSVGVYGLHAATIGIACGKSKAPPIHRAPKQAKMLHPTPGGLSLRVESCSRVQYSGPVYDLQLDATNELQRTFSANGVLVHNSSHLLEDFEHWEPVLREWVRVLKPGGKLVILVPDKALWNAAIAKGQPPNCEHRHEAHVGELSTYADKLGLKVIEDRLTNLFEGDYTILFVAVKS